MLLITNFLYPETAKFVNELFEALTNSAYLPQTLIEPSPPPVPVPTSVLSPQPTPTTTTTQEKPRKTSLSEDVLTTRVLAEVSGDTCNNFIILAGFANFIDEWSQCTFASQILESFWNIWSQVSQQKKPFSDFPACGPGMYTLS